MNWVTILVIVGVVSLILGPIMLTQPTKMQRRHAMMRQRAVELGLRVHLQAVPDTADVKSHTGMSALYCLPWSDQKQVRESWLLTKRSFEHELHFSGVWDWQGEPAPWIESSSRQFMELLNAVPDKVFALGRGPQGVFFYWAENGDVEDVESLTHWLKEQLFPRVISATETVDG